jgi:hypothetical protein
MVDLDIRRAIADYLAGGISPGELEDRLHDFAWDVDEEPARSVAADALLLLAEHQNGDWTDDELRACLGAISRTYWFDQAPKHVTAGSSQVTRRIQLSAGAGRWLSVASA